MLCAADLMPVRVRDAAGRPCLLVLPSDAPSTRQEAAKAEAALHHMLADPAAAAKRAAAWRQQLLLVSSSAALLGLTAGGVAPPPHQQQLRAERAGTAVGAAPGGGTLAGPSWLAASPAGAASGVAAELVQAVRGTSSFLQTDSCSDTGSLGMGAGPAPTGRQGQSHLGLTKDPQAVAAPVAHLSLEVPASGTTSAAAAAAAGRLRPRAAAAAGSQAGPGDDPAWDGFCFASLAAGLAVCMAEVVRQVEVGCAERGRLLAQLWNGYTGVLTATIQQQQQQVQQLATDNANLSAGGLLGVCVAAVLRMGGWEGGNVRSKHPLCKFASAAPTSVQRVPSASIPLSCPSAEASMLRWEASGAEFLRKEIMRLRNVGGLAAQSLLSSRSFFLPALSPCSSLLCFQLLPICCFLLLKVWQAYGGRSLRLPTAGSRRPSPAAQHLPLPRIANIIPTPACCRTKRPPPCSCKTASRRRQPCGRRRRRRRRRCRSSQRT